MRSTVIGAGSWGTALASVLASKGFPVVLWGRDAAVADAINHQHENTHYLKGLPLPATLGATTDLRRALEGAELIVTAVPSQATRAVMIEAKHYMHPGVPIVSAAKGIEVDSLMTMNEVLEDVLPVAMHPYFTFLSGPSFAKEVAKKMPTAVAIAGNWERVAKQVQQAFHTEWFRAYTSHDVAGCEIGGCVKNVIAIAAGLADGMGFGLNARAALITRGLHEIGRLATKKGANPLTLSGLAGLGDLVLTCSGDLSRNRTVGFGLGQGKTLEVIQKELGQVAEGVKTAKCVHELSRKLEVDMPICDAIYKVLYEKVPPKQAVMELLSREAKAEFM
jgi:glycerol-3-phosphate dehydrogenase (NAD(P)+)